MTEFLQSDCHQAGIILVSHGSAIIAELMRLSNHIPDVFLFQKTEAKAKKGQSQGVDLYVAANGRIIDPAEVRLRYSEQQKFLQILFTLEYIQHQD